jgi:enoyl-CoA hydratase/carnithine racemase
MQYSMSSHNSGAGANGRGSDAWAGPWSHLRIDRRSGAYCRIRFAHAPVNTITSTTMAELAELVDLIEQDDDLRVVVFSSANSAHYLGDAAVSDPRAAALWSDLLARLPRSPVVTIAAIRGRVRGAGSAFALACDLRFASRENSRLGQLDAGAAPVPRLARLVGRGRALEILLVAEELDGPRAESYGYVNRTIPDARLDAEVDAMAERLSCLDRDALVRTKADVERVT